MTESRKDPEPKDLRSMAHDFLREAEGEGVKADLVRKARKLYEEMHPEGPPWDQLPSMEQRARAALLPLVENDERLLREQEEPTYSCPRCYDKRFISRPLWRNGQRQQDVSWFCDCQPALAACAAYWFEKLYPTKDAKRRADPNRKALKQYHLYEKVWPQQAAMIRTRIDRLLEDKPEP